MVPRDDLKAGIQRALRRSPIVVLTGPRQCGKTTLAREFLRADSENYFDLEDPASLVRLEEPMTALRPLSGLVVIDEVQRLPDLFPALRVLADRAPSPARFLILGSASGSLLRQTSESLAGRAERVVMSGFTLDEIGAGSADVLWRRGGLPRSFLAPTEDDSVSWRGEFILSLIERDLPQWGVRVPAIALRRFWTILAHYHGQIWNATDPAASMGVGTKAVRHYLDLLTDAYMIRQLHPWHANLRKRQVKAPKVYVRDSGLLHRLLGIATPADLYTHPKLGASWEGFAIEQVLAREPHDEAYFWATHQGAEIDLVLRQGDRLVGVECKRVDAPRLTASIRIAVEDLGLSRVVVVYPGERRYRISEAVEAVPLRAVSEVPSLFSG